MLRRGLLGIEAATGSSSALTLHVAISRSGSFASQRAAPSSLLTFTLRRKTDTKTGKAIFDPTKEDEIQHKSPDEAAAEMRESKIYTMQQYMDKMEQDQRATRKILDKLDEVTTDPTWMLWGLLFVAFSVGYVMVCIRIRQEKVRFDPRMRAVKSIDQPGGPSIGGPFTLQDVNGRTWTEKDFIGKWIYIYFGFSNCPDICPEEMNKMTRMITKLDKKVGKDYWQPIFISIDPSRDTPAVLKEYLSAFHPRILGLTGTTEEVERAAREYRVYFAVPDEHEGKDDYLIDHSIIMYLMDPTGKFCDYTTKEFSWFESYNKLLRRMVDYEKAKPEGVEVNERVRDCMSITREAVERIKDIERGERAEANAAANAKKPMLLPGPDGKVKAF